jgi:hypothetical protein
MRHLFLINRFIFFIIILSLRVFANDKMVSNYYDYHSRVSSLYTTSLKLAKKHKDSDEKSLELEKEITGNLKLITQFCSTSYESQIYYNSLNKNIETGLLNFKRKEVYTKCSRMQTLLSKISYSISKTSGSDEQNQHLQNHQNIFNKTSQVIKELRNINLKIEEHNINPKKSAEGMNDFQSYSDFDCDWQNEKKVYSQAQSFLKSELKNANNKIQTDRSRGIASNTKSFEFETLINELERRHKSFEKICEEIQLEKDKINKKIKSLF